MKKSEIKRQLKLVGVTYDEVKSNWGTAETNQSFEEVVEDIRYVSCLLWKFPFHTYLDVKGDILDRIMTGPLDELSKVDSKLAFLYLADKLGYEVEG